MSVRVKSEKPTPFMGGSMSRLGLLTIIGISWAIHWAIFYVKQYKQINEKLDKIMQKLGIEDKNAK